MRKLTDQKCHNRTEIWIDNREFYLACLLKCSCFNVCINIIDGEIHHWVCSTILVAKVWSIYFDEIQFCNEKSLIVVRINGFWFSQIWIGVKDFGKEGIVFLIAYSKMNDQLIQTWVSKLYCLGLCKFCYYIVRIFHWLEGDVKLMYCWWKLDNNEDLICKLLWQLLNVHLWYQKTT